MAAHGNAVENLVIFAPLILMAHALDISTALTETAAVLYFVSRVAHTIMFTFRVPVLRIVAFFGGFIAQMMMVFTLLGWAS
jgi:uncharacterized MAPEG superfamily protein